MRAPPDAPDAGFMRRLGMTVAWFGATLVRKPRHSRSADARRALAMRRFWQLTAAGALIIGLMFFVDVLAISAMPVRGAPQLWPVRLYTDLAENAVFLVPISAGLILIAVKSAVSASPFIRGVLAGLSVRLTYIAFAILVPSLITKLTKGAIGRGRPFVGGEANAFNFHPFAGDVRFESMPSGHATTAFAAAFAISAVWPQTRTVMWIYAGLIAVSRVVLLAHHPSDVVTGAVVGILGAVLVQHWFASRGLAFVIGADGRVVALPGPGLVDLKRVVGGRAAP